MNCYWCYNGLTTEAVDGFFCSSDCYAKHYGIRNRDMSMWIEGGGLYEMFTPYEIDVLCEALEHNYMPITREQWDAAIISLERKVHRAFAEEKMRKKYEKLEKQRHPP